MEYREWPPQASAPRPSASGTGCSCRQPPHQSTARQARDRDELSASPAGRGWVQMGCLRRYPRSSWSLAERADRPSGRAPRPRRPATALADEELGGANALPQLVRLSSMPPKTLQYESLVRPVSILAKLS